jgi:hypothetical protein
MKRHTTLSVAASAMTVLLLAGCAAPTPTAPTITAVPPAGKSLTLFQNDDYTCRNYAQQTVAYPAATQNTAGNGGAAAGALFGAVAGNAGAGAAIGAGAGLLGGSAVAAGQTNHAALSLQQIYNSAYAQCMTSRGNGIVPQGYGAPAYGY